MSGFISSFLRENPGNAIAIGVSIVSLFVSGGLTFYANKKANNANQLANEANLLSKQANMLAVNVEFKTYYLKMFSINDTLNKLSNLLKEDNSHQISRITNSLISLNKGLFQEDVPLLNREVYKELKDIVDELGRRAVVYSDAEIQEEVDYEKVNEEKIKIEKLVRQAQNKVDLILDIFK